MLTDPVLVLNNSYEPLVISTVRRAVVMVYLGKARLVEPRDGQMVRSISRAMREPSVVRLEYYARVPFKNVMLNRKNIIKRDEGRCQYCGASNRPLTVDHVIPRLQGGTDTWDNLVCACDRCNNKKGDRTPAEAGMSLLKAPARPSHLTFMRQLIRRGDEIWSKYLFGN
ncbi:MAG: HNH endonuclease [candidate division Zixibacteria bacterium]|nr:HNH endonuclease [candidate division Zixibacteria bacterium]